MDNETEVPTLEELDEVSELFGVSRETYVSMHGQAYVEVANGNN